MKRVKSIRYLWCELILQLIVPAALLAVAFIAVYHEREPTALANDLPYPDMSMTIDVPFLDLSEGRNSHATIAAIISVMGALVPQVWPDSDIRFHELSKPGEWTLQSYRHVESLSFLKPIRSFTPFGVTLRTRIRGFPWIEIRSNYDPPHASFSSELLAMLTKATVEVLGYNSTALPNLQAIKLLPNVTETPRPTPSKKRGEQQRWAWALLTLIAILFQSFPPLITLSDEAVRGVRVTMQAHGLTSLGYWLGNFMYDFMFTLLFPIGSVIGVHAAGVEAFESSSQTIGLFFLLLGYCACNILTYYTLLVRHPRWQLSTVIIATVATFFVYFFVPNLVLGILKFAGLQLEHPLYPLLEAALPVTAVYQVLNTGRDFSRDRDPSGMIPVIWVFIYPLFPIALMMYTLSRKTIVNRYVPSNQDIPLEMFADEDVIAEQRRLDAESEQYGRPNDMVAANHIWKKYDKGAIAVKGITFGVHKGECFGLLGTNGAGKTTAMRMMQLEIDPSGGQVTFGFLDPHFKAGVDSARQILRQGVCQQHDTLCAPLTGEEHMHMYLALRLGSLYREEDWDVFVGDVLRMLRLPENRKVGEYSGGMKRKLAVAIAMFTGAQLAFLDEPSTGLDPFARRLLWRVITASLSEESSVVLTTHSMEEADAACGRLCIVAEGTMKCIGSSQHLKKRFGTGYIVTLVLSEHSDVMQVDRGMQERFGSAKPSTVAGSMRQYPIGEVASLSATYRTLEQCEQDWRLERYAISQCNLQQVFIVFAQNVH